MSYLIGAYQYFDNSFLYDTKDYQQPKIPKYLVNTTLGYIQKEYPQWFTIIEKAGRLNFFESKKYTMFIPNNISLSMLTSMDRQRALHLFNIYTVEGNYNIDILRTSCYQQLQTLISGITINIEYNPNDDIFYINNRFIIDNTSYFVVNNVTIYTIVNME